MNEKLPQDPESQPSGQPFGPESASEPTQPVGQRPPAGFGTPQPHHPGYESGYGYPPPGPWSTGYQQQNPYAQPSPYAAIPPQQQSQPAATSSPKRRRGPLLIASLAVAAVIGAGVGVGSYALLDQGGGHIASPITVSTRSAPQQAKTDGTVEGAVKVVEPSVVTITVQAGASGDIGSGVVLDKQGHILTNNHVVAALTQNQGGFGVQPGGPSKITVTFNSGRTATAHIVGTDETDDLAVIKVNGVKNLTPAHFAKSSSLSVGQSVVAVGAPLGLSQTVTSGIVSNTARPVRSGENNDAVYMAVQTDAAINPGNSGGPLVDLNGSVVGINSSIASTSDGSSGSQAGNIGIGFAIPSDVTIRVASQLIATGKSSDAVLGVTISGLDGTSLGSTTTGVQLEKVQPGTAAAKAGLRAGDVVTSLNGFHVTTADGLIAATHYYAPGTTVTVTYRRGGRTHTTQATLG
ncbi:MAG: trypsin-like peptidase domain-containing protein [Microlunatus sp.]|nr:trypsin-like peptidase domain-containing protein [Microlunatus sp.]